MYVYAYVICVRVMHIRVSKAPCDLIEHLSFKRLPYLKPSNAYAYVRIHHIFVSCIPNTPYAGGSPSLKPWNACIHACVAPRIYERVHYIHLLRGHRHSPGYEIHVYTRMCLFTTHTRACIPSTLYAGLMPSSSHEHTFVHQIHTSMFPQNLLCPKPLNAYMYVHAYMRVYTKHARVCVSVRGAPVGRISTSNPCMRSANMYTSC
jgi:hypothetical protein